MRIALLCPFCLRIASILQETDEQDYGAFYLRDAKPPEPLVKVSVTTAVAATSALPSSSDASRRSSHVSFRLPQSPHARGAGGAKAPAPLSVVDYMEEVMILRQMIEEYSHLVSVFDSDETDMDGYVISALLSSGKP